MAKSTNPGHFAERGSFFCRMREIAVLYFCFSLFTSFCIAQNFFPSEMGNRYQIFYSYYYEDPTGNWGDSKWLRNTLSNDTIINGNRFVRFSNGGPLGSRYYYFDENAGWLFIRSDDSVRLAIDFNCAPGDSFISYINGDPEYYVAQTAQTINFFGNLVITKEFVHSIRGTNLYGDISYTFGENIGLINRSYVQVDISHPTIIHEYYQTRSAIIDTNEYGRTSLQINSLSPVTDRRENQFPFTLTGNYTSTLNIAYGDGNDQVDSFYVDVIQVRASDTLGIFRYYFDSSHTNISLFPEAGDKLLFRAYISDTTIFNNNDIYPDSGYIVMNVLPEVIGPNYFPMKEGNTYQFIYVWSLNDPYPPDTSLIKLSIVKGDSIDGDLFYRFAITGYEHHVTFNPLQQFRYDSLNSKLWTKLPGDPQVRLAVDFDISGSFTSYILGPPYVFIPQGVSSDTILGQQCHVYLMSHSQWSPEFYTGFYFASGIGLSGWYYSSPTYRNNEYTLIAAILDSVAYSGPFRIDSITPRGNRKINQFPLQVKTFYKIEHSSVVDSFYLYTDHYRNGILLETFVKYIPHPISQGYGTAVLNVPDRQIGDIIKLRAEATDSCMLHHHIVYPDTGWVVITITDSISDAEDIPESISYNLNQNYPNPFNPSTTISYSIPERGKVRLIIYDALGREVRKLVDEEKEAGKYEIKFNADGLSSGMYFYRLSAADRVISKKMILLK